ncbi:MAG TPA: ribokinase [Leptolyngbyaceae cyanobacterium M65_K2018_010]|nr:ribokinase [Leptolyngbyaceae cyanobacterium M65_K2018_010]
MDLVCQTPRLPQPGETILGHQFQLVPGGKGANQAVAIARLGAPAVMVGRVGGDGFGQSLIASLQQAGVSTAGVMADPHSPTGIASIVVDRAGSNHIVVVPGANGQVDEADVQRLARQLQPGDGLLMQLEIPLAAVLAAATAARGRGAWVVLDPAPARTDLPDSLYPLVDYLTPNQVEAGQLVGFAVTDQSTALAAAQGLRQRGAKVVMVKLGAQGVIVASEAECFHQPAMAVPVVDTVAAGDAFNGGLAVGLAEGLSLPEAVQWATAVAAYSVTQCGAQPSLPTRSQVHSCLATHSLPPAIPLASTGS